MPTLPALSLCPIAFLPPEGHHWPVLLFYYPTNFSPPQDLDWFLTNQTMGFCLQESWLVTIMMRMARRLIRRPNIGSCWSEPNESRLIRRNSSSYFHPVTLNSMGNDLVSGVQTGGIIGLRVCFCLHCGIENVRTLFCTSGGVARTWIGVPRRLYSPGKPDSFRCACIRTTGPPSNDLESSDHSNRGDLDSPHIREYEGCNSQSESCEVLKWEQRLLFIFLFYKTFYVAMS